MHTNSDELLVRVCIQTPYADLAKSKIIIVNKNVIKRVSLSEGGVAWAGSQKRRSYNQHYHHLRCPSCGSVIGCHEESIHLALVSYFFLS